MRSLLLLLASSALALFGAACADDGKDLRPPDPGFTTSTVTPQAPDAGVEAPERLDFLLAAVAFDDGGSIPARHTCDGDDISPALSWEGVPFGAAELAITVTDTDARGFTHWAVSGLSPALTGIDEGQVPEGAVQAFNDFGTLGWAGPCPPGEHRYVFTLHVLPEPLGMVADLDAATAVGLIESSTIQAISVSGTYGPAASR